MNYIKIDSEKGLVTLETFPAGSDRLKIMQRECAREGLIEVAHELDNHDTLFIDEEGLFKNYETGFSLNGHPFHGNGIVCGHNPRTGETANVKSTALEIAMLITFLRIKQEA